MTRSLSRSPGRLFYGWWIVIIGCIQDAVKGGTFNTGFTLYFLPVLTELHLSRAATSLPFSLAKLESALEGPLVGYLIDQFDVRVMLVVGTTLAGLGFVLLSFTQSYVLFVLVFIGPLSVGFQAGFNQATMATVNHWFLRKRWLAMSIRRYPESMGLLPDGERRASHVSMEGEHRPVPQHRETHEFTAREALRTPAFWLLAAFHGLRNVPYSGVSVHLVPLLVWKGLDEATAAFFVGLTALSTVVVRPLTGWLGDRHSKQRIGALGVLLGALGLVVLTYSDGALWPMVFFAILFSFGDGINSVTWALVGDCFGRTRFATIRGWISMFQSFASMPAAVFTGWIYDQTQSYTYALIVFIICYGVAGLLLWLVPHPKRPTRLEVQAGQALSIQP